MCAGAHAALPPKLRRKRTVLVFGKSQVGKSHLLNVLLMRPGLFAEGDEIQSCTLRPRAETVVFEDRAQNIEYEVTVVDSPGMFDSRTSEANEALMAHITDFIKYSLESVSRIFYVFKKGQVSPEEVDCMELFKGMLTEEAQRSGLCSMVVTNCDRKSPAERERLVASLRETAFGPHLQVFAKEEGGAPEIIPVDFSPESATLAEDRERVLQSILTAPTEMHKTKVYRLFAAIQEAAERKKIRDAFIAMVASKYRTANGGRSVCPVQ